MAFSANTNSISKNYLDCKYFFKFYIFFQNEGAHRSRRSRKIQEFRVSENPPAFFRLPSQPMKNDTQPNTKKSSLFSLVKKAAYQIQPMLSSSRLLDKRKLIRSAYQANPSAERLPSQPIRFL